MSRLFRISSEIDYFQNLGLFKKTIQKWILLHPLLTAKIGLVESELYFVSTEPDAELKNVQFYNIDSESLINSNKPTQKQYDEIIDLLLENESFSKLSNDDKLWRLTFIKQTNTVNDFDIIFSIHHSITEGRNVCYIFLQLLNMFEEAYTNKPCLLQTHLILPSMEDLFLRKLNENNQDAAPVPSIKRPSFIDYEKAKLKSSFETSLKYDRYADVLIKSADNGKYLPVSKLINSAKLNQSKFELISFSEEVSSKLIVKLKQQKVKMQPFLNVLFSMVFKKIYNDLGNESEQNHKTVYGHTVSLRQFSDNQAIFGETINDNMGFFTSSFFYSLSDEITMENFWFLVHKENDIIQQKLTTGEQFKNPNFLDFDPNELFGDFELSNLGIIGSSFNENSLHKIKSCFLNARSESPIRIAFNNFVTVNNLLYWSLMYNSYVVDKQFVCNIIEITKDFLNILLEF